MFKQTLMASALALTPLLATAEEAATAPTLEQLAAQVRAQQAQIEALTAAVEKSSAGQAGGAWYDKTTIGGYGEAYFKRIDGLKDEYDAYRLVLFVGHKFSDRVRFGSELEIEHAYVKDTDTGTASPKRTEGYLALEQLFLEYQYADHHRVAAGQLLVPVAILNETHEPDTFYGTFRAPVEREIVPGTWYETGVMFSGEILPGFSYDVMLGSGLKNNEGKIKDGRQRGSKADGSDPAYTARLKYTGLPGLELGLTGQWQTDMAQGTAKVSNEKLEASLVEAHIAYASGPFSLRALYAKWELDAAALVAADKKRAEQNGWYVEPAWKVLPTLGVFARYSVWDNEAADSASSDWRETSVGVNWWLHERAVVKADWQWRDDPDPAKVDADGYNLGIGFSF